MNTLRNLNRNPIRLGILGCGSFAIRRILPILKELDIIEVVCLQKRNLLEAQKVAGQFSIPHAVATREELLAFPKIEAILIATPNHMHEEDALACAQKGKHVLCEKPLAPSVAAIERMRKAFDQSSLFVGQSLRFKYAIRKAKELLQSGTLGSLLSIKAHFSIQVLKDNWRFQKTKGGGALQDIGVHLIDLIRFITQKEFESVYAMANSDLQEEEAEHSVLAACRLQGDAFASFECSFQQPFSSGFEVIGSQARLISRNSLRQSYDQGESLSLIQSDDAILTYPLKASNVYVDELKHFAESLAGQVPSILRAEEGLENQKVIEAAFASIRQRKDIYTARRKVL